MYKTAGFDNYTLVTYVINILIPINFFPPIVLFLRTYAKAQGRKEDRRLKSVMHF